MQHRAIQDYDIPQRRLMHRTTMGGVTARMADLYRAFAQLMAMRRARRAYCRWTAIAAATLMACLSALATHAADLASPQCADPGATKAPCVRIVFDGDSIAAGQGASDTGKPDRQFLAALNVPARISNVAVGGRPVQDCLRLFGAGVAPLFAPDAAANIIVFHAGDNDIRIGKTAAETYSAFGQYIAAAHSQGWKIVVSTEMQRVDFAPPQRAELAEYNRLLLANSVGADAVVDINADSRFADLSRRTDPAIFNADRIHPSDGGYAALASLLAPTVRPLLKQ